MSLQRRTSPFVGLPITILIHCPICFDSKLTAQFTLIY